MQMFLRSQFSELLLKLSLKRTLTALSKKVFKDSKQSWILQIKIKSKSEATCLVLWAVHTKETLILLKLTMSLLNCLKWDAMKSHLAIPSVLATPLRPKNYLKLLNYLSMF